uniref:Uncharacterized protein n=1 Tax=Rhizophora mucronata TaxID=61149 RepID=A0A2P2QVK1_RHIMU
MVKITPSKKNRKYHTSSGTPYLRIFARLG